MARQSPKSAVFEGTPEGLVERGRQTYGRDLGRSPRSHSAITHGQAKSQEQLALGQRGSQMTCDGHALTNLAVAIRNRAMCSSRGARQRAALLELERYERAIARWTFTPATREQGAAMLDQLLTLQQRVERLKAAALPMKPVVAKAPYAEPSLRVRTTTKLPRARRG